jgi:hypothetical protein
MARHVLPSVIPTGSEAEILALLPCEGVLALPLVGGTLSDAVILGACGTGRAGVAEDDRSGIVESS